MSAEKNQRIGSEVESYVSELLKDYNPQDCSYKEFFDMKLKDYVIEIKGCDTIYKKHKTNRYYLGKITVRVKNHRLLKEYCECEGLIPVYIVCFKLFDGVVHTGWLWFDDVDKFIKEGIMDGKRCIGISQFFHYLKSVEDLKKMLKIEDRL